MNMSRIIKTTKLWPALLATACSVFLLPAMASAAPRGDVNQDGEFDIIDIQVVVNKVIDGIENDALAASYLADVDCDEEFDVVDIQLTVGLALAASGEPGIPLVNDTDGDLIHNNCEGVDPGPNPNPEQATVSCEDCNLQIHQVSRVVENGALTSVELQVYHAPFNQSSEPRLADVRVHVNKEVTLSEVTRGAAMEAASKVFYVDPISENPWKLIDEGANGQTYQVLIYTVSNTHTLGEGGLFTMRFTMNLQEDVTFNLVRRSGTFAPDDADSALNSPSNLYENQLVVSHE